MIWVINDQRRRSRQFVYICSLVMFTSMFFRKYAIWILWRPDEISMLRGGLNVAWTLCLQLRSCYLCQSGWVFHLIDFFHPFHIYVLCFSIDSYFMNFQFWHWCFHWYKSLCGMFEMTILFFYISFPVSYLSDLLLAYLPVCWLGHISSSFGGTGCINRMIRYSKVSVSFPVFSDKLI